MTDNEIIKTYECCFINGGDCNECPLMTVDCLNVDVRGLVFDLIKRTKLESKRYRGKCSGQKVELTRLYEENNRQQAEIDRYKGVIQILEKDVAAARNEGVKELAHQLIDKAEKGIVWACDVVDLCHDLTNILPKEGTDI